MNNSLVSVIITTYKASKRLAQAIKSVLMQNYEYYEIIIVDDNNPNTKEREFTEKIMNQFSDYNNIIYIQHEHNKNGAAARNTGLKVAKGSYIAFLDDDDEFYQNRLKRCVETLDLFDDFDAVYTNVDIYKDDKYLKCRQSTAQGNCWKELLLNEGLLGTGSNLFFRKKCLDTVKNFDERFVRYQDVEFMLRLVEKHKLYALNETLVRKNLENTNIPDYGKYKTNKMLIFSKFSNLINQLDEKERNFFFSKQYSILLNSAVCSCNKTYIKEAMIDLSNYKKIDWKTRLKCAFPGIYKSFLKCR